MFGRGSIFLRLLAALLLLGVLAAAGWMIFQAGQAQGYAAGAAAAQSGSAQGVQPVVPQGAPYYPGYYGYMRPHFFPFFPLFGIFWFFVIFFIIGGLFRMVFWGWRRPHHHHGPWQGGPGYYPPWAQPPAEGGAPAEAKQEPPKGTD